MDSGTLAGRTFDLESGFLTVGRGDTCSIRFDPLSERIASKQHAFIEAKADGYYITDNQSTNGTLLNGNPVTTAKLNSGDQIQFGRNGVIGTVKIEGQSFEAETATVVALPQESFRDLEVQQFNQIAAAAPVSMQTSLANVGLGSMPAIKPEPSSTGKYIGIAVTGVVIAFLMLIVILITVSEVGLLAAIIASFVAFIPAAIYVIPLLWLDRYDPEPAWLLALAFAWGGLVAIVISFIINSLIGKVVAEGVSPVAGEIVSLVASAPIFEEGSKGIGVVLLLIFFRKYFDDILDGIVFAGVIALGFATVENILYYGRGVGGSGGVKALAFLFLIRGIMSPFAHATFTSMTGIGCGISRESHNPLVRFIMPIVGYIVAVTLHATWNGLDILVIIMTKGTGFESACNSIGLGGRNFGYCSLLSTYAGLEVPLFLIITGFAIYVMRRQGRILKEMLAIDIARGLISEELGAIVTSPIKSSSWLLSGLFAGKYRARSRYLRAAGRLGLSYWHIQRATAAQGQTGSFQQNPILREEVLKWRDQV